MDNHFFSLSCILFPHVRAGPDYEWPNHLYLSPTSPLIPELKFPPGFDIEKTPLASFRRLDLLLDIPELIDMHKQLYNPPENFTLFNDDEIPAYTLSPKEYLPVFTAPLPLGGYSTLVTSTAGHWNVDLMFGFYDKSKAGYGIDGVLDLFKHAVKRWAYEIQEELYEDDRKGNRGSAPPRRVVARGYLPGHEECHSYKEPWKVYNESSAALWNWPYIKDFNKIFEVSIS